MEIQLCANQEDYFRLMDETNLEMYVEKISHLTFGTSTMIFELEDIKRLQKLHQLLMKKIEGGERNEEELEIRKVMEDFKELGEKIDETFHKNFKECQFLFIRLSTRSPKDSILFGNKLGKFLEQERKWIEEREKPYFEEMVKYFVEKNPKRKEEKIREDLMYNQKLQALYRAMTYSMACSNGMEAIELLGLSKRIQGDLDRVVENRLKKQQNSESQNSTTNSTIEFSSGTDMNIIVREFRFFDVELEFRGFVYKKKLTGLTQYNDYIYFHEVNQHKEHLLELIQKCFEEELLPNIPLQNYVIDFVLVPSNPQTLLTFPETKTQYRPYDKIFSDLKVMVVELNPLAEFAGSGLFSWTKHKSILLNEKCTVPDFRIVDYLPNSNLTKNSLPTEWIQYTL